MQNAQVLNEKRNDEIKQISLINRYQLRFGCKRHSVYSQSNLTMGKITLEFIQPSLK